MTDPLDWTVEREELLQDCKVFSVSRTLARSPRDGAVHPFFRLASTDWVNIVPLTAAGEVVMIRQFRHGKLGVTLEIPGGMVDPGETPAVAAARELREETGYAATTVRRLGDVNPNPALWTNRCHTFLAEDVRLDGAIANAGTEQTGTEQTVVELIPLTEIPARLRAGEIDHALVIVAFHWLSLDPAFAPDAR